MDLHKTAGELASTYDHFSPDLIPEAPSVWAKLRAECPVARSEYYGGFWLVTTYDDVWNVANDWQTFTSAERVAIPPNEFPQALPIEVDPPLHRDYRRILNPPLSPQGVAVLEADMERLAKRLVGDMAALDRFDFGEVYSGPFVRDTVMASVGLPEGDRDLLSTIIETIASHRDSADQVEPTMKLVEYLMRQIAGRRTSPARDDVLGALVAGEVGGRPITDEEIVGNMITTIFGGLHTTTGLLNNLVHWVVQHPGRWERLRDEPDLLTTGVEEVLRVFASSAIARTATRDVDVHGCPIRKGDKVQIIWGSANLDESEFDSADEVIFDRPRNRHLSFGAGPHRCVGSHLAKLMVKVSVRQLLLVLGDFELDPDDEVVWHGGETRGIHRLPLRRAR